VENPPCELTNADLLAVFFLNARVSFAWSRVSTNIASAT
jgi:hypothetical protein